MALKIIVLGDATDHGGKVISGSPVHDIGGKPVARLGDTVDCPVHGENRIVSAHPALTAGGVPVAVDGCESECGSRLIGSGSASVAAPGA
jgi:uncharacterized Zn-binding protein involved in type VI secretion